MKQAALATHSTASVAGNYLATFMWDDIQNGQRRVGSGYAELNLDGVGGLTAQSYEKASDGTVTNETISAAYVVQNVCIGLNALAKEAAAAEKSGASLPYTFTTVTGGWIAYTGTDLRNARDGVATRDGAPGGTATWPNARLQPTDSTCSGGEKLQLILGYDPTIAGGVFATGNPKIAMMIGQTGEVLTFTDPHSFGSNANRRQLGVAVKLQ